MAGHFFGIPELTKLLADCQESPGDTLHLAQVNHSLSEIAVDSLWANWQYSLVPLLKLLPERSLVEDEDTHNMLLSRELDPDDWKRFQFHARHMKKLVLGSNRLFRYRTQRNKLILNPAFLLHLLKGPTSMHENFPRLQVFQFLYSRRESMVTKNGTFSLCYPESIRPRLWRQISSLSSLRNLALSFTYDGKLSLPAAPLPKRLQSITINASPTHLTEFLPCLAGMDLEELNLGFAEPLKNNIELYDLVESLSDGTMKRLSMDAYYEEDSFIFDGVERVSLLEILPILQGLFPELEVLIANPPVAFQPFDFSALDIVAGTWQNLTRFELATRNQDWKDGDEDEDEDREPLIHLSEVVGFATGLPNLVTLKLLFILDPSGLPTSPSGVNKVLTSFGKACGDGAAEGAAAVAAFIHKAFPKLQEVLGSSRAQESFVGEVNTMLQLM